MGYVRHSLENFASQIVATAFYAFVAILTARLLGVGGRGEYALFCSVAALLATTLNLGIPSANVYFCAGKRVPVGRLAANSKALSLAAGVICLVILLAFRDVLLRRFLPGFNPTYVWLLLPITFILVLQSAYGGIALGCREFRLYNVRQVVFPAILLVATVASLFPVNTGVEGAVLARTFVILVVSVWFVVAVGKRIGAVNAPLDMGLAKDTLAYGMKSHIQNLVCFLNDRLGLFLVSFYAGREAAGLYSVATAVVEPALYMAGSFGIILFPKLSATEPEEAFRFTCVVSRNILFITLALCLLLVVGGRHLILLAFGDLYTASVAPMLILLPGAALRTLYIILTRNFSSRDRQEMSILAAAVALGFNGTLNLILAPRYGVLGAALAVSVAYASSGLVLLSAFVRDSGLPWHQAVFPRQGDLVYYRRLLGVRA